MKRVLIAGPGRSGTSALTLMMSRLGYASSAEEGRFYDSARAGFESGYDHANSPIVVKNPGLTWWLPEMLEQGEVTADDIRTVLIPFRDLDVLAASRLENSRKNRSVGTPGGLTHTSRPTKQADVLSSALWLLLLSLEEHGVPYRLIHYPRFMLDGSYFSDVIRQTFPEADLAEVEAVWSDVREPDLVRWDIPDRPNTLDDVRSIWWRIRGRAARVKRSLGGHLGALGDRRVREG